MKWEKFYYETKCKGNEVYVVRCGSGHDVFGEAATFHHKTNGGQVVLETKGGKRIRVKNFYGKTSIVGAIGKDHFVISGDRADEVIQSPVM